MAKKLPLEPPPPLASSSSTLKTATTNNVVRIRISLPTGELSIEDFTTPTTSPRSSISSWRRIRSKKKKIKKIQTFA